MNNKRVSQDVALTGILAAQAIALSYLESLIPLPAGFPPGAKPGFSNIVVMFSAGSFGIFQTVAIAVFKAVFAGITRGMTAFFMSLCGGLAATAAALILLRSENIKLGYTGISMICAVCHNTAQLCVACIIASTPRLFLSYGPFLLLAAAATGFLSGTVLKLVMPALEKQMNYFKRVKTNKRG